MWTFQGILRNLSLLNSKGEVAVTPERKSEIMEVRMVLTVCSDSKLRSVVFQWRRTEVG